MDERQWLQDNAPDNALNYIDEFYDEFQNENERLRKVLFVIASRNVFIENPTNPDSDNTLVFENRVEWLRDKAVEALNGNE